MAQTEKKILALRDSRENDGFTRELTSESQALSSQKPAKLGEKNGKMEIFTLCKDIPCLENASVFAFVRA